jgi:hypothetical protein
MVKDFNFESMWRQNAKARGCDIIIDKAEHLMLSGLDSQGKTISEQDKAKLSNLVTSLKSLFLSDNKAEIERVTGELSDLIFDPKLSDLVTTFLNYLPLSDNKAEIERVTEQLSDLIFDLEF